MTPAEEQPEKLKELHDRLLAWRSEVDAKLPSDAPQGEASWHPHSSAGQLTLTEELEGFECLRNVELKACDLGFELASHGNGLAFRKLDEPIESKARLRLQIRPSAAMPSNGFLALAAVPTDADAGRNQSSPGQTWVRRRSGGGVEQDGAAALVRGRGGRETGCGRSGGKAGPKR
jgi:hypothetical protein